MRVAPSQSNHKEMEAERVQEEEMVSKGWAIIGRERHCSEIQWLSRK